MSAYQNTPYRVLCQIAINSRSDPGITFDDFYQAALRDQDREIARDQKIVATRDELGRENAYR